METNKCNDGDSIRERVRQLRGNDPNATAAEMAEVIGVSREWVRQVLIVLGLPTRVEHRRRRLPRFTGKRKTPEKRYPTSPAGRGTVGELLVAAHLTALNYTVYAPICRHNAHADLIALKRGEEREPFLIEVKLGHRSPAGTLLFSKKDHADCDYYAVVLPDGEIVFAPPLEDRHAGTSDGSR